MVFELHIEELVLHGVPPSQRGAVADGVQRRLAALFRGAPVDPVGWSPCEIEALDGGAFQVARAPTPGALGGGVARAVHAVVAGRRLP